jgi:hypothetical protein
MIIATATPVNIMASNQTQQNDDTHATTLSLVEMRSELERMGFNFADCSYRIRYKRID